MEGRGTVDDDPRLHFYLLLPYRWELPAKVINASRHGDDGDVCV